MNITEICLKFCRQGSVGKVRQLLDQGLDVDSFGGEVNFTFLMEASWRGSLKIVTLLLERGANINSVDKFGRTALMLACYRGHLAVVKLLLQHRADVAILTHTRETVLFFAIPALAMEIPEERSLEIVRLLLEQGVNCNIADENGYTALMLACGNWHAEIVKLLLKYGADRNMINKHGETALIKAQDIKAWKTPQHKYQCAAEIVALLSK